MSTPMRICNIQDAIIQNTNQSPCMASQLAIASKIASTNHLAWHWSGIMLAKQCQQTRICTVQDAIKTKNMNKSPLNWILHWKPCQQITWHGSEIENCLQNGVNRHESQLQKWQACDKQTARVTSKRSKTIGAWYLTSRLKQSPVASKQSQTKKVHRPDILTMSEHVVQTVAAI